jgi:two-component system OmpR family response regulator
MVLGDHHDELFARLAALLRRYHQADGQLSCDDLTIDLVRREVSRAGRNVAMPLREFDLLSRLARSADQPVSRTDLFRAVWRMDIDPGTNRIDVHMSRLRQRVDAGHARHMLRTVKGFGYALVSERGEPVFERQVMLHHA